MENSSNAKGKTTGASQQTLVTIIKSWVTTPCGGLQDHIFGGTLIYPSLQQRTSASLRQKSAFIMCIWILNIFNTWQTRGHSAFKGIPVVEILLPNMRSVNVTALDNFVQSFASDLEVGRHVPTTEAAEHYSEQKGDQHDLTQCDGRSCCCGP